MAKIVFEKLTIKETGNVRAGVLNDYIFGELCNTPDTPGAACNVSTPQPKTCRTKEGGGFKRPAM
jgi:hypothetical protein